MTHIYIYIYITFHPTMAEYKFFSSAYGTFYRADPMLILQTNINKFKRLKSYKIRLLVTME